MSNPLADLRPDEEVHPCGYLATAAGPLPQPTRPDSPSLLLVAFGIWAIASLVTAFLLGFWRKNSIRGPERLRPEESAWWLLMIPCASILVAGRLAAMVNLAPLRLPVDSSNLLNYDLFVLLVFLMVVIGSMLVRKDSLRLIGIRLRQLPFGLFGGLLLVLLAFPFISLAGQMVSDMYDRFHLKQPGPHEVLQMMGASNDPRVIAIGAVTAVVVAPLFEELLFRGMIQTMLSRLLSVGFGSSWMQPVPASTAMPPDAPQIGARARWGAVVMTSIGFAAIHTHPAWFLPLFLLSVALGYAYERTGNLWVAIAAHSLFNSAQILLFRFQA